MANIQALGPRCPRILRRNELPAADAAEPRRRTRSQGRRLTSDGPHTRRHGPGCATDPSSHWVTAVSPYATWRDLGRLAEQLRYRRKPPIASGLFKPSGGLESQTPSLPWRSLGNRSQPLGNRSQPTATLFACLSHFRRRSIATGCHRLRPRGSIKAPCFVVCSGYVTDATCPRAQKAFAADFHSLRRCAMSSARSFSLPVSSNWRSAGSARR
jgi:hypothetical protein